MAPATAKISAFLFVVSLPGGVVGRLGVPLVGPKLKLCAESIVQETCALLDASGGVLATPEAVQDMFSATPASVEAFWRRAGLPSDGAACSDLCGSTTALLKAMGRRLPRSVDTGCYKGGSDKTECDVDLAPEAIQEMANQQSFTPFKEGIEHHHENEHHNEHIDIKKTGVPSFNYTVEEVAVRVAQLFRIYPALDSDVKIAAFKGPAAEALATPDQTELLTRRLRQAQAYLNIALRTFPANKTARETEMFFGKGGLTSRSSRKEIQMVLNSVNNVLSNATFVYPGPSCTPRVFAYVYPCRGGDREKDSRDRFYVHLCDLFFTVGEEQICTLVHEASHHATACTADVQYGAEGCKRLALTKPEDAMRNADNYGYYIRQVARSFGTF